MFTISAKMYISATDLEGLDLLTKHLKETLLVLHPMRRSLGRNLKDRGQKFPKVSSLQHASISLIKYRGSYIRSVITRTYQVSFGRRNDAFVWRGGGKLNVGDGGRGFCGMGRAGMDWSSPTILLLLLLFIHGLPTLS